MAVYFFQAVRLLLRYSRDGKSEGSIPASDSIRFATNASVGFSASDIQALTILPDKPAYMTVNFMGLVGPSGVLPLAYTTLLVEQVRSRRFAFRDFLDIFNHRLLALHYAAWEKYHLPIALERRRSGGHLTMLQAFIGLADPGLSNRLGREYTGETRPAIRDIALCYYVGLLSSHRHSAVALEQLLSDYFDVDVHVEQFAGGWRQLDRSMQTRLEEESLWGSLGKGSVIGDEVQDTCSLVRICIGPLSLDKYVHFLPGGSAWTPLRSLVRFFSQELEFELQLKLKLDRKELPACRLGSKTPQGPRLGWLTWMSPHVREGDLCDTILRL